MTDEQKDTTFPSAPPEDATEPKREGRGGDPLKVEERHTTAPPHQGNQGGSK